MAFVRKIKKGDNIYLAEVKSIRDGSKVKQKFIRYVGKEINGKITRKVRSDKIIVKSVKQSLDVLAVNKLSSDLTIRDIVNNDFVMTLVYSQLLEQRSINRLGEWIKHTEIPDILNVNISTKKLYHALTDISEIEFEGIEEDIFSILDQIKKTNKAAVIDVTDIYFEGSSQKVKPRRGKDSKVKRLIQLGLSATLDEGFPIFHRTYHGNLSNFDIYKDMVLRLRKKNFSVVIMDRGMMSKENLKMALKLKTKVIAGLRKTPTLKKDYLRGISRDSIFTLENRIKLKNTSVYAKQFKHDNGKIIVVYNPSLEVLKTELNFEKGIENKEYIGYSLIYHNTNMSYEKVVKKYYEKEIIERAFKQLKGMLNVRPIRVWLSQHVKGHMRVCYLAYAILALMNYKLKKINVGAIEALDSLKQGYKVKLEDKESNLVWDALVTLEPRQKKILKALDVVYKT
jgi:transposase